MTVVTIAQAQKALTRSIASANKGEDIIITKGKTPVARLIGVKTSTRKRVAGRLKGKLRIGPKFFEPLRVEELAEWGME